MKKIAIMIAFLFAAQISNSFAQTKTNTEKMFTSYFMVKNALATDNAALAAKNAKQLQKDIAAIKTDSFNADELKVWTKESENAQNAVVALANATEITNQRKIFGTLSNSIINIAKAVKTGDKPIYLQYCPMAKQSWLNEKKNIENPYYGKSMLECGTVKEVFNGK